ncbi:MAG: iron-siderophore ABC transporter substrate-binding protein [Elainella sp. Prado103]|jgi:iron complex transport system substrate-binding protein|nr:iron-siderophore ABC transporter substrate-binding protein [Elainella sp. Prado103]
MVKHRIYIIQFLIGFILILLWIPACQHRPEQLSITPSDCRIVHHAGGTSCIPQHPQRVVTLDGVTLEYLLSLEIQPIGAVLNQLDQHLITDQAIHINNVGTAGAPNLEKILQLKPDLILGLDFHQAIYAQVARIAPVVLFEFGYSGQWKEAFQNFAAVLGKDEISQQVIDRYYQRLEQFKARIDQNLPEVSVIRIDPVSIYPYFRESFCGVVLQDAGLPRPPAQNLSAIEAQQQFNNPIQTAISKERLDWVDGDVIFVWIGENMRETAQTAQRQLEQLQSTPLWSSLSAVQQKRVYSVPSYWIGSGPIAANRIIDDLFKYLVDS